MQKPASWAEQEFGRAALGDVRRTRRLQQIAAGAARRPSGKVAEVFDRAAEREGAYDFLESPLVKVEALAECVFGATAERASGSGHVYVSVDGSSLATTDENGSKGLGSIGSPNRLVRGLMVMNALAVSTDGVALGLVDQIYWNRIAREIPRTRVERNRENAHRPFHDKETSRILDAVVNAKARLDAVGVATWAVIDREGDNRDILMGLHRLGCLFTVRARCDRYLWGPGEKRPLKAIGREPSLGTFTLDLPRNGRRTARRAVVDVRATQVVLHFRAHGPVPETGLRFFAVRVREKTRRKKPLEWLLYTNAPVLSPEHARKILESYRARWRVEEFHRTWKRGGCNVEDAQLRSPAANIKWATVLAAVATRIERLKYLARTCPDEPAPHRVHAGGGIRAKDGSDVSRRARGLSSNHADDCGGGSLARRARRLDRHGERTAWRDHARAWARTTRVYRRRLRTRCRMPITGYFRNDMSPMVSPRGDLCGHRSGWTGPSNQRKAWRR